VPQRRLHFQAVKARPAKFDRHGFDKSNDEIDTIIRQVTDKAPMFSAK
jgi:hypothetical protein